MLRLIFISILLALATFSGASLALAQSGGPEPAGRDGYPSDNDVNSIAKNLYCPVCPNTPLDVCETKACVDWRAQIRDQLAGGWSQEEIMDYFVAQYGERVLAEPQRKGFTSLVWMLPVIATLLGLVVIWQVVKSWLAGRNLQAVPEEEAPHIPAEVLAGLEKELREMD